MKDFRVRQELIALSITIPSYCQIHYEKWFLKRIILCTEVFETQDKL